MASLMDVIMQEYRSMPAGSPDFSLGSRRDFTPMAGGGTYNDRGNLGNMGLRQSLAAQAPTGTSPITPTFNRPMPQGSVSGPSTPMGQLGSATDQRAAFERMVGATPAQPNYFTSMSQLGTPEQQRAAFEALAGIRAAAPAPANPLANPALNQPVVAGLGTENRPAPMASSVTAPAREQGFFEKLFKGPQYQSNNMPVGMTLPMTDANPAKYINWGDPNNAADFFRADALLQQQNPGFFGLLGGGNG